MQFATTGSTLPDEEQLAQLVRQAFSEQLHTQLRDELQTLGETLVAEIRSELKAKGDGLRSQTPGQTPGGQSPGGSAAQALRAAADADSDTMMTTTSEMSHGLRNPRHIRTGSRGAGLNPHNLESVRTKADKIKKHKGRGVREFKARLHVRRASLGKVVPLEISEAATSHLDETALANLEARHSISEANTKRVSVSSDLSCDVQSVASDASDEVSDALIESERPDLPTKPAPARNEMLAPSNLGTDSAPATRQKSGKGIRQSRCQVDARNAGGRLSTMVPVISTKSEKVDPIQKAVMSTWFDGVVCVALVLNAAFIGIQANDAAQHRTPPFGHRVAEVLFCVFFTTELAVRLYTYRIKFFTNGDKWNWFDLALVVLQLVDELAQAIWGNEADAGKGGAGQKVVGNMSIVRLVRVLRLLRILRLLRVIRFVSELKKVLYLIIGSLASFCWTALLLILLIYILAVFFTQVVAENTLGNDATQDGAGNINLTEFAQLATPEDMEWKIKERFGGTLESVLTLYQAITGGFDWHEVSTPLFDVSPWVGLVFAAYTAFAVLVLLNLVTGVFVDGALRLSRADKEQELLQKAYELFENTSLDHGGAITWEEFQSHLDSTEMGKFFEVLDINMARAEDLFHLINGSEDGKLRLEELVAGGLMLQGPAKAIDVASLAKFLQQSMNQLNTHLGVRQQHAH